MITNTEELKKYVSVSPNFNFEDFSIYIPKAIRAYVKRYVGDLYKEIDSIEPGEEFYETKAEAKDLLDTAVANFAFYLYTPYISITMDGSGLYVVKNDKRESAPSTMVNDIRRELLRSGHEAMDELLQVLEDNADVFTEWHNDYSTLHKSSLVHSTTEFNKYFNIHNSRQTFLSLKASIINVEDRILSTTFTLDFLEELKGTATGINAQVKSYLQKAIVHGTIAKVCAEGVYEVTPSSIILKFDLLDYERKQTAPFNEQMKNAIISHTDNMNNYLKLAYSLTEDVPGALRTKENINGYKPIITKSILGL